MKTVIRINNDYHSQASYQDWRDEINQLVNSNDFGVDVYCEISNDRLLNPVEEEKNYLSSKDDYKNVTCVTAKGYSQGDWQEYKLYHNCDENDKALKALVKLLERSFTHFNDYFVEKFERTEIDGKVFNAEPHDFTNIIVDWIEFPEKEDVLKAYNEIYGEDYDEVEFNLN